MLSGQLFKLGNICIGILLMFVLLLFSTADILENVDASTIPDTLVQRLQEEK